MRRRESLGKEPNAGHYAIASMEEWADVQVVTQNVDNLHERAGSSRVLHLHGELMKLRSERNPNLIYDINEGWEQSLDARGEDGALLRPHIVFFGESVPMFEPACQIVEKADILIVVGTSLAVYPAALLVHYVRDRKVPIYLVDPGTPDTSLIRNPVTHIKERGAVGVPELIKRLRDELA
jgi:NAD-dependent deacetylase